MRWKGYNNQEISMAMCIFYIGGMFVSTFVVRLVNLIDYGRLNFISLLLLGVVQLFAFYSVDIPHGPLFDTLIFIIRFFLGLCFTCILTNITCQLYKEYSDPFNLSKNLFLNALICEIGFNFGPLYISTLYAFFPSPQIAHLIVGILMVLLGLLSLFEKGKGKKNSKDITNTYTNTNTKISISEIDTINIKDREKEREREKDNYEKGYELQQQQQFNEYHQQLNKQSNSNISKNQSKKESNHYNFNNINNTNDQNLTYQREMKLIEFVSNSRMCMNVVLHTLDCSQSIFMQQVIVSTLMSAPYWLDIQMASVYTSVGTLSIVINASIIYLVNYVIVDLVDSHYQDLQFEAPLMTNPILTLNASIVVSHSVFNMNYNTCSYRYDKDKDRDKSKIKNTYIRDKMETFSNLNSFIMNNSLFNSYQQMTMNSSSNLESGIIEDTDLISKTDNHYNLKLSNENLNKSIHDRLLILAGRCFYTFGYFIIAPYWAISNVYLLKLLAPVGLCLVCLGYCYSYMHMNLEFVQAVKDYINHRRRQGDTIDEPVALDKATMLLMTLWQGGALVCPILFSLLLDHTDFGTTTLAISAFNCLLTLIYAMVLIYSTIGSGGEVGEEELEEERVKNRNEFDTKVEKHKKMSKEKIKEKMIEIEID